jgi:hypothetical protein
VVKDQHTKDPHIVSIGLFQANKSIFNGYSVTVWAIQQNDLFGQYGSVT